jgi:NADH-quinone oxidoreductase subunit C
MSITWPEGVEVEESDASGTPCFDVPAARWLEVVHACKAGGFTYFDWLSAVDEPDATGDRPAGADVVVHLVRPAPLRRVLLRARVAADDAEIASITGVFAGAAWHERETHEMFGIGFSGFDDGTGLGLRPLLLPDGFEGTPLRKSFVLASRAVKAWPGAKEPGESGEGHAASPSRRKLLPPGVPDPALWGPREAGEAPGPVDTDVVDPTTPGDGQRA